MLKGWLTYTVAVLTILYGIFVEGLTNNNWQNLPEYILAFLALLGLRRALPK